MKTDVLVVAAMLGGYMALNIGANDVANNVGPAVGANAIKLGTALVIAAVFEAAGALIAGAEVVRTIRHDILDRELFTSPDTFVWLMLAALLAGALWLNIANAVGAPVSTTHAIVGAVAGAGMAAAGPAAVNWATIASVTASWVISPLMGGAIAAAFLYLIKRSITYRVDMASAARRVVPLLVGAMAWSFVTYLILTGLDRLWRIGFLAAAGLGAVAGMLDALWSWGSASQFVPGVFAHLRFVLFSGAVHAAAGALAGLALTSALLVLWRGSRLGDLLEFAWGEHVARRARDPREAVTGLSLVLAMLPTVAIALFELLVQLPAAEIADFDNTFEDLRAKADTPEMTVAALLIEHGFLGEASFDDFRAGLVALGRSTFEAALANPDVLADHPVVREIAAATDPRWLGREDVLFVASHAYSRVTGEDAVTFFDFAESLRDPDSIVEPPPAQAWQVEDEEHTRARLPRLSQLFYEHSLRNRRRALEKLGLPR